MGPGGRAVGISDMMMYFVAALVGFVAGFVLCAMFAAGTQSDLVVHLHKRISDLKDERDWLLSDWHAEHRTGYDT
jgi:hypothetical protein